MSSHVLNCFLKLAWHRLEFMNEQKVLWSTFCTEYSLHKMCCCNSASWDFSNIYRREWCFSSLLTFFMNCFCAALKDRIPMLFQRTQSGYGDECIPEFLWAPKGNNRFEQPIGMGFVVAKLYLKQWVMFGLFDCCLCPKQTILLWLPQC